MPVQWAISVAPSWISNVPRFSIRALSAPYSCPRDHVNVPRLITPRPTRCARLLSLASAIGVARVMAPLSSEQVAKITHENAMRHYHFDPFASRSREQCTVAALRAESPEVDTVTRVGRPATERDAQIFKYALRGIKVPAAPTSGGE